MNAYKSGKNNTDRFNVCVLAIITIVFLGSVLKLLKAEDIKSHASQEDKPTGQINLSKLFLNQDVKVVGFADTGEFVLSSLEDNSSNFGTVNCWDVHRNKMVKTIRLTKWLGSYDLTIMPCGKLIVATNDRVDMSFPHVKAYRATFLSSSSLKNVLSYNFAEMQSASGLLTVEDDCQHIVIKASSLVKNGSEVAYGPSRLDWLNSKTGKIDKSIPYWPSDELDKVAYAPGKKYLIGLFYSEVFNPTGESDYAPIQDQFERHGFVDVINPKNGKILWHLKGTDKQPVGDPLFFISPTRFVSSDSVFNIQTHKARHWNAITPTRKCLAAVPGHPNCALFLTPSGLQLRDWQKDKMLVNWPTVKKPGRILFSPDLKMFSFKRGSVIQFWRFSPKWVGIK